HQLGRRRTSSGRSRLHGVGSSPLVQVVHCALLLNINSRVVDELGDGEAEIKRVIRDNSPLLGIAEQRALRIAAMHHEAFHSFRVPRRLADGDWCREPSEGHQRELLQTSLINQLLEIINKLFARERSNLAVGQPAPTHVVADQREWARRLVEKIADKPELLLDLQVHRPASRVHQRSPLAQRRISNLHAVPSLEKLDTLLHHPFPPGLPLTSDFLSLTSCLLSRINHSSALIRGPSALSPPQSA